MPKRKVDETKYAEIKAYARTHSIPDTVTRFKVCRATVTQVINSRDYESWRESARKAQRENYLARKAKIFRGGNGIKSTPPAKPIDGTGNMTANGGPFGDTIKPKPILPIGATKTPEQDGPIVVKKTDSGDERPPLTLDDHRRCYNEQKEKISQLTAENTKLTTELEELKAKKKELEGQLENAIADKKNEPQVVTKSPETTEIEIMVGDATIKVSTKGGK